MNRKTKGFLFELAAVAVFTLGLYAVFGVSAVLLIICTYAALVLLNAAIEVS